MPMSQDEFRAGGYLLVRPSTRDDEFMAADLLPRKILSLSSCLCDIALEYWWNEENVADAAGFGVSQDRLSELTRWYLEQFDTRLGAPGVGYSVEVLREFVARFVPSATDLVILGAGVAPADSARLRSDYPVLPGRGKYGVYDMIERNLPLEPDGTVLGFEILSYEYGLEHSWLCNALERAAAERLDVIPNSRGFIGSYEEAASVAEYANREEIGAEPGLWLPWLVVRYPLTSAKGQGA